MEAGLLERAARLAQGADPQAARPLVEAALAANPADADALTVLGLIAQRGGDTAGAVEAFGRARAADPGNPARIGNHAVALKQAGLFEEAIAAFKRSLAIRPGTAATLANLGSCLIEAGRETAAEPPLRAAIAANPDHADAWNNLGVMLARTGRAAEAVPAYRRVLALRPGHGEATLNLADILGDSAEAEALAARVLRDRPGHPRAANLLAGLRDRASDLPAAIAIYQGAFARAANPAIGINLTMALLRADRAADALALTDTLLAATPAITTPLALRCVALDRLGLHEALADLMAPDRFVSIVDFPADPEFHAALAVELRAHPSLTFEPAGLVTRSGRQSDDLADAPSPALSRLAALARQALAARHVELDGGEHPWTRARPEHWTLTMWGTILQPGGAVEPHIHAPNWLSGVYYPALPGAVEETDEGGLAIGVFPAPLGGGGTPRVHAARAGRMILFPSWLWHGTLPFGGEAERISFAFDLVPHGIGRPHRLAK